MIKHLGN